MLISNKKKAVKTFLFFTFNTVIIVRHIHFKVQHLLFIVRPKLCQLTDFRVLCIINLQLINPKIIAAKADETNIAIQPYSDPFR